MTRRDLLTAAELTLATSALTAAVYGLVSAAYDPYAAVRWVPIAIVGAGTALAFVGLAAVLFVGRAALLLAGDAVQARRNATAAPPSAVAPLWPTSTADQVFEAYDAERAEQQHAEAIAAVAAEPMRSQHIDDTAVMPVVQTGLTWGFGPTTPVVDAPPELWTAPTGRHAGVSGELREFDYEPAGVAR